MDFGAGAGPGAAAGAGGGAIAEGDVGVGVGMGMGMGALGPLHWYHDLPVVSRVYLTGAVLTTAACALDLISPFYLYFHWDLVVSHGQLWRLVTSYLFFGFFNIDYVFHMSLLVRYSRLLEEGEFRGRTADFVLMLVFGATVISIVASFLHVHFLGSALTYMMAYVWGRRNEHVRMTFLGFISFNAPYLPWAMVTFSFLFGHSVTMDLIGIGVGHVYYFLEFVYPTLAQIRNYPWFVPRRILHIPPAFVQSLSDLLQHLHPHPHID